MAYAGWVCAEKTEASYMSHDQIAALHYEIRRSKKDITQFDNYAKGNPKLHSGMFDYYTWTFINNQNATNYSPARDWKTYYLAFENCEFHAKFEIEKVRSTASSAELTLYHPYFFATMFVHDFVDIMHWTTYDTSDPSNVKKYIEGVFTFEKRGSAITMVGVKK